MSISSFQNNLIYIIRMQRSWRALWVSFDCLLEERGFLIHLSTLPTCALRCSFHYVPRCLLETSQGLAVAKVRKLAAHGFPCGSTRLWGVNDTSPCFANFCVPLRQAVQDDGKAYTKFATSFFRVNSKGTPVTPPCVFYPSNIV